MKNLKFLPFVGLFALGSWWLLNPPTALKKSLNENGNQGTTLYPEKLYGIELKEKDHQFSQVKSGETFSTLLSGFGIGVAAIQSVIENAKDIFNPAQIRAGKKICLIRDCENNNSLTHLIYEENEIDYLTFHFSESPTVERKQKPVKIVKRVASGEINGSLWNAFEKQKLPLDLVMRISEIYAWEIDFFRLQKGDRFKVEFEEQFVEGKSIGVDKIHAIRFIHEGRDYYGFHFVQDEKEDYYDEQGNSLRKAFLKAPLKFTRISSGYSNKRFHPILRRYTSHPGIDYAAPTGTPIMAVGDGTILEAQYKGGNGNYVKIRHNQTFQTQYLHMSKFGAGIKAGAKVRQGQIIGYVGSTGLSTGPHLCYRFWKNGVQVNPLKEDFPTAEPIKKENKKQFDLAIKESKKKMESLSTDTGAEVPERDFIIP